MLSTKHYINLGGSEMVVYRATPADVESGVQVGDLEYPGLSRRAARRSKACTSPIPRVQDRVLRAALRPGRQHADVRLFARDEAGNAARADFDHLTFPKPFKKSRIELDDKFLDRVVPAILASTTEVKPEGDDAREVPGDQRRAAAEERREDRRRCAKQTRARDALARRRLPSVHATPPSKSAFADQRTYIYKGKEVDQQTHLGFDLASFTGTADRRREPRQGACYADELGIYGNCVIIDHGMGVQSLYGHLSSIGVKAGEMVEKEQELGTSGMTGLAGGDHLHFTMLVNGQMVNPVEWWDPHWIQDRILRKLHSGS